MSRLLGRLDLTTLPMLYTIFAPRPQTCTRRSHPACTIDQEQSESAKRLERKLDAPPNQSRSSAPYPALVTLLLAEPARVGSPDTEFAVLRPSNASPSRGAKACTGI